MTSHRSVDFLQKRAVVGLMETQFRLPAVWTCSSPVVMLWTKTSEVVSARVLAESIFLRM